MKKVMSDECFANKIVLFPFPQGGGQTQAASFLRSVGILGCSSTKARFLCAEQAA